MYKDSLDCGLLNKVRQIFLDIRQNPLILSRLSLAWKSDIGVTTKLWFAFLEYSVYFSGLFSIRRYRWLRHTYTVSSHHLNPLNRRVWKLWCVLTPCLLLTNLHNLNPDAQDLLSAIWICSQLSTQFLLCRDPFLPCSSLCCFIHKDQALLFQPGITRQALHLLLENRFFMPLCCYCSDFYSPFWTAAVHGVSDEVWATACPAILPCKTSVETLHLLLPRTCQSIQLRHDSGNTMTVFKYFSTSLASSWKLYNIAKFRYWTHRCMT